MSWNFLNSPQVLPSFVFLSGPARLDEKITFKKPVKRTKEFPEDSAETEEVKTKQKKHSDKGKKSSTKMTKNTNLLSFGDEDAEEG